MPELTCIVCPLGCRIAAEKLSDGTISISGNSCPRGKEYAFSEITAPTRIITATVLVEGRDKMLPVKTTRAIPKDKIFPAMEEIKKVRIAPPVKMGQIILKNLAGTGIALVSTKSCE